MVICVPLIPNLAMVYNLPFKQYLFSVKVVVIFNQLGGTMSYIFYTVFVVHIIPRMIKGDTGVSEGLEQCVPPSVSAQEHPEAHLSPAHICST